MYTVIDAAGNELYLEDHQPCPPGCSLQIPLQFLDSQQQAVARLYDAKSGRPVPSRRAGAAPAGFYTLIDCCGRPSGVASVEGARRVQDALERSRLRYKRKPRQVRDGEPALRGQALYRWRLENAHKRVQQRCA